MNPLKAVENNIFKIRYVYVYSSVLPYDSSRVISFPLDSVDEQVLKYVKSPRLSRFLNLRHGLAAWQLFIYLDNDLIKGYSFLHIPNRTEWNDSLPTLPMQARTSSTFVEPEYRGHGIRSIILWEQYLFCQRRKRVMWSVIEKSNISSIRSTEKSGGVRARTNYLIKFAGRNVFSILNKPLTIYFLIGNRRNCK